MKKLISILFLFAVLAVTNVSFGQDESPGKKIATENQIHLAPVAIFSIQEFKLCDFAPKNLTSTSQSSIAVDNISAIQPVQCLPTADFGNQLKRFSFSINSKKLYASNFFVPAHKTQNCATGYVIV